MFNRYYQQELSYLKELAVEFSKAHPALAPMLSGQSQDPDVERLLEAMVNKGTVYEEEERYDQDGHVR